MTLQALVLLDGSAEKGDWIEPAHRAKAALLYADLVTVQTVTWGPLPPSEGKGVWATRLPADFRALLAAAERDGAVRYWPALSSVTVDEALGHATGRLMDTIDLIQATGAPIPNSATADSTLAAVLPPEHLPLFASANHVASAAALASRIRAADRAEAMLATRLLGDLPAFPDATLDVVLDVRERLSDARTRFRAVMAAAAKRFIDVPPEEFDQEVSSFRREQVDDALVAIRQGLADLGAASTLSRMLKGSKAIPAGVAMGLGAAALSPSAMLAAASTGGAIAAVAEEWSARRGLHSQLRGMPYWYLHDVGLELGRR